MNRRLYFLFPDREHIASAIDELKTMLVHPDDIYVYAAPGTDLSEFHAADNKVILEASGKSERIAWNANLLLFFIALAALVLLLIANLAAWATVPLVIMIATFTAGLLFTTRVPNVHLDEFTDAVHHGEILVMVDVPRKRVTEIEHALRAHHPEVTTGGVGWTMNPLHR